MFIRRLHEYFTHNHDLKDENGVRVFPDYGWFPFHASFTLSLNEDGSFDYLKEGVWDILTPDKGALDIANSSNIDASLYHGNMKYVLGSSFKKKFSYLSDPKKLDAFIKLHEEAQAKTKSSKLQALLTFLKKWRDGKLNGVKGKIEGILAGSKAKGDGIVISVNGKYLHDDKTLKAYWNKVVDGYTGGSVGVCLVTGKKQALRRIHGKIKGVVGTSQCGGSLVSFNQPAHRSYGTKKTLTVPIGCKVEFGYRTALNHFLSDSDHSTVLGGNNVVFWTGHRKNNFFCKVMKKIFGVKEEGDKELQTALSAAFDSMRSGRVPSKIPEEEDIFYVAALSGNNGRVFVREFLESSIGEVVQNVKMHDQDTRLFDNKPATIRGLAWATIPDRASNSKKKPDNTIYRSLVRAIIKGEQYPLNAVVMALSIALKPLPDAKKLKISSALLRVRSDTRLSLLKGYLNRKYRQTGRKEIGMGLDKTRTNTGYLMGRLLSLADQIHEKSLRIRGGKPNKSLSDRFRSSMGSTPRFVFKDITDKVEVHLSKIKSNGNGVYLDKEYTSIISALRDSGSVPARLSIEEQIEFVLGFRHQHEERFTKKEGDENNG